jgi:predicted metal-binding membrane protein
VIAWALLAWLAVDMGHPLARLTMPASAGWRPANVLAVGVHVGGDDGRHDVAVGVADASLFHACARAMASLHAGAASWPPICCCGRLQRRGHRLHGCCRQKLGGSDARQHLGSVERTLLLIAGIYQFSPLKRICLARCRTPMGFLLGEWRSGAVAPLSWDCAMA